MTYTELKNEIEAAPITWLPAMLIIVVETCMKRGAFQDADALREMANRVIASTNRTENEGGNKS